MGVLLISGCVQSQSSDMEPYTHETSTSTEDKAKLECIFLCKASEVDLSNGPCLSDDNPRWKISDWVCDVAHSPRETVDNLPENQCQEFREGKASHFVEIDPNCNFIKAV